MAAHNSKTFIVVQHGRTVAEHYWACDEGFRADVASAQKSVISFLIGMAQERGLLSIGDSVAQWLGGGWTNEPDRGQEAAITVRHLLTMSSGLDDELRFEAEPGSVWRYNNNAYHQVKKVLEAAAGTDLQNLTETWLWSPIGCTATAWEPRPAMKDVKGVVMTGYVSTARDMARFGHLVASGGRWGDDVLLGDGDYLAASTSTSQPMNESYGYLWWLGGKATHMRPLDPRRHETPFAPDGPPDAFAALGAGDQKIWIAPSLGLVWCRQGGPALERAAALSRFDNEVWKRLMEAVGD